MVVATVVVATVVVATVVVVDAAVVVVATVVSGTVVSATAVDAGMTAVTAVVGLTLTVVTLMADIEGVAVLVVSRPSTKAPPTTAANTTAASMPRGSLNRDHAVGRGTFGGMYPRSAHFGSATGCSPISSIQNPSAIRRTFRW